MDNDAVKKELIDEHVTLVAKLSQDNAAKKNRLQEIESELGMSPAQIAAAASKIYRSQY